MFNLEDDQRDLAAVPWNLVYLEWFGLCIWIVPLTKLFTDVIEHHAPTRKSTIKAKPSPWIDQKLTEVISQRDEAKAVATRKQLDSDAMLI